MSAPQNQNKIDEKTVRLYILEYIWIDGSNEVRSKTRILREFAGKDLNVPEWTYDGSSTGQAEGFDSDVILKPCSVYRDPFRPWNDAVHSHLVMCETYNKDGTPHKTNKRNKCKAVAIQSAPYECLFGIEQEYVIYDRKTKEPYMWKSADEPGNGPQGPYYCSAGGDRSFGREIAEKHMRHCLEAGIMICGINAEVMPSQWEFQIGVLDAINVSDQLWVARYILNRICEESGCQANYHPKPKKVNWNGSGCHTNFSTKKMREEGGYASILDACKSLEVRHKEHMIIYGEHNEERLTGLHETSSIDKFSFGEANRGCSVRIPLGVVKDKKGYLEDRRPASNMDPYLVTSKMIETICFKD